jgi:leucyl aminopeptidase (aminopeptidase T)
MLKAWQKLLRENLGLKGTERLLVFTDRPPEGLGARERLRRLEPARLARQAARAARAMGLEVRFCQFRATGGHAQEPPESLWRAAFGAQAVAALKDKGLFEPLRAKALGAKGLRQVREILRAHCQQAPQAVLALSYYSSSHTLFRGLLCGLCQSRYASMPLFDARMLHALDVDYHQMRHLGLRIKRALQEAVALRLTAPGGSELYLRKGTRAVKLDDGLLRRPGAFGNLPAGEVYFAPLEGTAQGRLVLYWAPTRRLRSPVVLEIQDGMVKRLKGREPFVKALKEQLAEHPFNANVAELGIGINPRARRLNNILESEKILGSVHVALGENSAFGGKTKAPFHQDFLLLRPTLWLIDSRGAQRLLIKDGALEV